MTIGQNGVALPPIDSSNNPNNGIFQITLIDATSFSLNGTTDVAGNYTGGGTVTPMSGGENDEGYARFDLQRSNGLQSAADEATLQFDDHLNSNSMQAVDAVSPVLTPGSVTAYENHPLRIQVGAFSSVEHPDGSMLMIFDGDPDQGAPAIASQTVHPGDNGGGGTYAWFDWTPTTSGVHHLYAKLIENEAYVKPGNNKAALDVNVVNLAGDEAGATSRGPRKHL